MLKRIGPTPASFSTTSLLSPGCAWWVPSATFAENRPVEVVAVKRPARSAIDGRKSTTLVFWSLHRSLSKGGAWQKTRKSRSTPTLFFDEDDAPTLCNARPREKTET